MSIDHSAAALSAALRAFGESLGRALAEGISRGVQEGLSRTLDLDQLASRVPRRAAEGVAQALQAAPSAPRRGGRPRGEVRPCRVHGCTDPARSRGLCSRHYQQELRREKTGGGEAPAAAASHATQAPIEAKPPIVRKRPEQDVAAAPAPMTNVAAPTVVNPAEPSSADAAARLLQEHLRRDEPRTSSSEAAKRIFG